MLDIKSSTSKPSDSEVPEWVSVQYLFYPFLEAIIISFSCFAAILITTYFIYHHALNGKKAEIQEGLLRTAQVAATFVDGDSHSQFTSPEQEDSDAYNKALKPLQKVIEADGNIAYVFTLIMKGNKVHFILDPTLSGDKNGDGLDEKSHIMQVYREVPAEVYAIFKSKTAIVSKEPVHDEWGNFMSAFAPVYDSHNKFVAVLGLSIFADNYIQRLETIHRATIIAIIAAFVISFFVFWFVFFFRKCSKDSNKIRHKIYQDCIAIQNAPHKVNSLL